MTKRFSVLLVAAIVLAAGPALAAGSGMPWEAPLNSVLQSIEGPVARILAVIIIIITGLSGLRMWIAGLVAWAVAHGVAVLVARRDPHGFDVLGRHLRHRGWLAC